MTTLDSKWLWCEIWCGKETRDEALIIDYCASPIEEERIGKEKHLTT